eukprot:scaffold110_cov315-Pavlova_lutheri.AAC.26
MRHEQNLLLHIRMQIVARLQKEDSYSLALKETPGGVASSPPSTTRTVPVIHAPARDDKNRAAPAISSAPPVLGNG